VNTGWQTQQYYDGTLGKPGVGLYLDLAPAIAAHELVLYTATPGWTAQIWARNSTPNRNAFDQGPSGWVQLGTAQNVQAKQKIPIQTGGHRYRYYLVWITTLAPHKNSVSINEVAVYKQT
jgi:hypothetical protein